MSYLYENVFSKTNIYGNFTCWDVQNFNYLVQGSP